MGPRVPGTVGPDVSGLTRVYPGGDPISTLWGTPISGVDTD